MNKAQKIALRLFGETGAEMERESREWVLVCPECGNEVSYWEYGGIRFGAASEGKRIRLRCERCGTKAFNDVVRRPDEVSEAPDGG